MSAEIKRTKKRFGATTALAGGLFASTAIALICYGLVRAVNVMPHRTGATAATAVPQNWPPGFPLLADAQVERTTKNIEPAAQITSYYAELRTNGDKSAVAWRYVKLLRDAGWTVHNRNNGVAEILQDGDEISSLYFLHVTPGDAARDRGHMTFTTENDGTVRIDATVGLVIR